MRQLTVILFGFLLLVQALPVRAAGSQRNLETDVFQTSAGELKITFIGHASLMFQFRGRVIHVDPWTRLYDYSALPKADLILVTHHHRDHLDGRAIKLLSKARTKIVASPLAVKELGRGQALANGQSTQALGLEITAVPAYNIKHMRSPGLPYHPRGEGNGYVITFGDKSVYLAGDTENTPEMKALKGIDIAFLPMNLPYTMTPAMVAEAARAFKPAVLYPYHYGETDPQELVRLLAGSGVQVRIRNMGAASR